MAIKTWGNMKGAALRVLVSIASSSAFLLFGYDQGVFAGLIGGNGFKGEFFNIAGKSGENQLDISTIFSTSPQNPKIRGRIV
jgi:hypothetical protein